jgi:hypothetical protein
VYSLLGAIFLGDPWWVITQNPYDQGLANYGSGTWGHYFQQYIFVVGVPIYGLTVLGLVGAVIRLGRLRGLKAWMGHGWLVHLPFGIYFLCHVVFWATGTGHSLGMSRVMLAIVPLGAVIAADGLQLFGLWVPSRWLGLRRATMALAVAYVAVFPFIPNPAALKLPTDLQLQPDQVLARNASTFLQSQGAMPRPLYGSHPSLPMFAGLDLFDSTAYRGLSALGLGVPSGAVMVWDNWFSVQEDGVSAAFWDEVPGKYALLWKADTSVAGAHSEMRVYRRE